MSNPRKVVIMVVRIIGVMLVAMAIATSSSAQQPGAGQAQGQGLLQGGQYQQLQQQFQQYPPINPANVMPNIFNPQYQPLSPYLNLFNNNLATRYYFGVRPGTVGGAGSFGGAPNIAMGGNRQLFFPQLAGAQDPTVLPGENGDPGAILPPAGHPVVFGSTLGYFPGSFNRGQRTGLSGIGAGGQVAQPKR